MMELQVELDATIKIYWYSNQLNMFRAIFCPSSGAQVFVLQLVVKCTQVVAGRYTTNCKTQSSAPEDGQKIARNMLSWLEY